MRFDRAAGFGIVPGHGVDTWDFDEAETFDRFLQAATETGHADLVARIRAGYEDQTPRDGRRWLVRYTGDVDWRDETLAARVGSDGTEHVLIELPTFAIVAPSTGRVHPSGCPYVRQSGGFAHLATYTATERDALLTIARRFDERAVRQAAPLAASPHVVGGLRPGDDFNCRASWRDVLEPHGWRVAERHGEETRWTRPGKDRGTSATANYRGTDLLHVFSSSTPFQTDRRYDKFAAYTLLTHGGDFAAATRALAAQGYGAATRTGAETPDMNTPAASAAVAAAAPQPVLVTLADVQPARVSWIWPLRLAVGKLHLLWGDPGVGKSTIALDIAARISRGAAWPDGGPAPLGAVVILTAEDGLADTVRPRLDSHSGDGTRVHVLRAVREASGVERAVSLVQDLEPLEQAITITRAVLVVVDPLSAYLGGTDSYRDAEVRTILAPLAAVAERTGTAICGVMHVTKDQQRQALYRGQGSIAFAGAARLVLAVGVDPDDPSRERRFLMPLKSNVGAPAPTLAYRIVAGEGCGRVVWEGAPVANVDVNAVLAPPRPDEVEERRDSDGFLRDVLADGPVRSEVVLALAHAQGFSRRTLFRAKTRLGVEAERVGGFGSNGAWYWRGPDPAGAMRATDLSKPATSGPVARLASPPANRPHFIESGAKGASPQGVTRLVTDTAPAIHAERVEGRQQPLGDGPAETGGRAGAATSTERDDEELV
jgi:hypothetical protein